MRISLVRFPDGAPGVRYSRRMTTRPLFVPLKTRYFRAFESGVKTIEYRKAGPRWNERTCSIGRPAILSHGYSGARLYACVASVQRVPASALADPDPYEPSDQLIAIGLELIGPFGA